MVGDSIIAHWRLYWFRTLYDMLVTFCVIKFFNCLLVPMRTYSSFAFHIVIHHDTVVKLALMKRGIYHTTDFRASLDSGKGRFFPKRDWNWAQCENNQGNSECFYILLASVTGISLILVKLQDQTFETSVKNVQWRSKQRNLIYFIHKLKFELLSRG